MTPSRLLCDERKKDERAEEREMNVKRRLTSNNNHYKGELCMALRLDSRTAEAASVSAATLIISHRTPRSNWTNNLHKDRGNGS